MDQEKNSSYLPLEDFRIMYYLMRHKYNMYLLGTLVLSGFTRHVQVITCDYGATCR